MAIEDYIDEARGIAAHAWCEDETSHLVMIPALAEAFARRLATWMDNAAEFCRNMDYYRGLLDTCAANLGPIRPKVFVQDDGVIVDEPLRAKLPELVAELAKMASDSAYREKCYRETLEECAQNLGPLKGDQTPLFVLLPDLVAELATHARKWLLVEQAVNESKPVAVSPSQFSDLPVE